MKKHHISKLLQNALFTVWRTTFFVNLSVVFLAYYRHRFSRYFELLHFFIKNIYDHSTMVSTIVFH